MNVTLPSPLPRTLLAAGGCLAGAVFAIAQSTPPPPKPEEKPADTVQLSPFQVVSDVTDTYDATNTNAVTGTSTSLNKTPLDARVFNRTMMDELGVVDVATMLSELGGLGMPLLAGGNEDQRGMQEGDGVDYKSMVSRGLTISNPRRDGFLRSETSLMDSFDVESAEALQGSNSLLFGSGDAGGVVNINSKRARFRQRSGHLRASFDSEGSQRFTTDLNWGARWFGVRINAVKGRERYYRPILGLKQEGLQAAVAVQPYKWLSLFADYRHYQRDHIRAASGTLRTPANLLLPNGEPLNNQSTRYIVGVGGSELLNDFITIQNESSITGAFTRHNYTNESKTATIEVTPSRDLAFQFRYGHDARVNHGLTPSSGVFFHPDAPGYGYRDANGALRREWAANVAMNPLPFWTGARGYKFTGAYRRDLGRWGDHRLSAFYSYQESWTIQVPKRFYELDGSGSVIQNRANLGNDESGRTVMPAVWMPAFSESLVGGISWPSERLAHPNGRNYVLLPRVYAGAVTPTAGNPLGLSGPIDAATGMSTNTQNFHDDTNEESVGFSTFSSFWKGRIDTMAGFRFETADTERVTTGVARGPIDYDSMTLGTVVDTPIRGLRVYASYATNAKIAFGDRVDINNRPLPIGKGVSRDIGFKFSLWDHRLSGNLTYYITEGRNFAGALGGTRNDVDPEGINGRAGGDGFVFSRKSDGLSASLSMKPRPWWQVVLNYSEANGSERDSVEYPIFYNDEFNTMVANGQPTVAIRSAGGQLTPLLVPVTPGSTDGPLVPLTLAMMQDRGSPYFATLDPESGQITNAQSLGLLTPGVGTSRAGLPISSHQLGFTPPTQTIVVRRAGDSTTGYAENAFSLVNRFQVREGRLRGLVFGASTVYQRGVRGYMYTDAAAQNARKIFYYPDKFQNSAFAVYTFRPAKRVRASVQLNVANVFDKQDIVALPRSTNGTIRYFAEVYSPRKFTLASTLTF
jgi:outer membrane receptor for ferric coprogen and ferric-rhodotorulic acid